jgi:hypothetical protein
VAVVVVVVVLVWVAAVGQARNSSAVATQVQQLLLLPQVCTAGLVVGLIGNCVMKVSDCAQIYK